MDDQLLRIQNLRAGYGTLIALDGVSLHVRPREIVVLIGANGAGKSTLLNSVMGLTDIAGGQIFVEGRDIARQPTERIVRRGVALVPESRQIFQPMSVRDNLLLGSYSVRRNGHDALREDLEKVYGLFPILRARDQQISGTLSGGEQQMLAIGRALMGRPKLLLLDEPSIGLAPKIVQEILAALTRLRDLNIAILLVEQNSRLALEMGDRGYVIETGRIVMEGDRDSLIRNEEVRRAYLGGGFRDLWE